ncbi:carbon catabolite repressor protein 4 homolog 1-like [Acanthaster planci]|uniref:Carbon catabolite repressor protein 4 homolog 1-like n=1 Tax=Acanthaster planci TaxID=133434 RepID=A0A8B7XSH5_ACAPL|nr:carbon catabolite repressor protein 4 homolog 1-like [Acanthaster planci]
MDLSPNLQRGWVQRRARPQSADGDFVVLTYNILNKAFCPEGFYPYCPSDLLASGRRHPLLMKEIDHHRDADVLCFQEVNSRYYEEVLEPDMRSRGYTGCYFMRPEDETTKVDINLTDGSATFYRQDRFQLVKEEAGHFKHLFQQEIKLRQFQPSAASSLLDLADSTRVYIFTLFRCLKTKNLVAIGNIHLTFEFFIRMDLTTLEAAFAVNRLVQFAGGVDVPHILCGDFNQEPHHPGYQLLHDGTLNETMTTYLHTFDSRDCEQVTSLLDAFLGCFKHNSGSLKSAYKTVVGHEVPFSDYEDNSEYIRRPKTDQKSEAVQALFDGTSTHLKVRKTDPEAYASQKFVAALDYVWFSSNTLHCDGVLEMVDEELIVPFHACPNAAFPSDHLPIKTRLAFIKGSGKPRLNSAL